MPAIGASGICVANTISGNTVLHSLFALQDVAHLEREKDQRES
jgi:hypothetical protein